MSTAPDPASFFGFSSRQRGWPMGRAWRDQPHWIGSAAGRVRRLLQLQHGALRVHARGQPSTATHFYSPLPNELESWPVAGSKVKRWAGRRPRTCRRPW